MSPRRIIPGGVRVHHGMRAECTLASGGGDGAGKCQAHSAVVPDRRVRGNRIVKEVELDRSHGR